MKPAIFPDGPRRLPVRPLQRSDQQVRRDGDRGAGLLFPQINRTRRHVMSELLRYDDPVGRKVVAERRS